MIIDRSALFSTYSYRDPNIEKTLASYDKISEIARKLDMDEGDFANQQISTMGKFLRPKSPSQKADSDFVNYKKENPKDEEEILKEIKEANLSDIRALADVLDKALAYNNILVFGNRGKILEKKDLFDKIVDLAD